MSWDFVEDAIDSLNKDECFYVLLVGKYGHNKTDVFFNIESRKQGKTMIKALQDMIDNKFKKE